MFSKCQTLTLVLTILLEFLHCGDAVYYAVARGRKRGIYNSWEECYPQIYGFGNARYQKCFTQEEAMYFIVDNARASGSSNRQNREQIVYVAGVCINNGPQRAKGGIGVFWGNGHPADNVGAPIQGEVTCNRAEYLAAINAMQRALERDYTALIIHTESNFMIDLLSLWIQNWKANGWHKNDGEPVANRDLLEQLEQLMDRIQVEFQKDERNSDDHGIRKAYRLAWNGVRENIHDYKTVQGIPIVYTAGHCINGLPAGKGGIGVFWGDRHPDNVSASIPGYIENCEKAEYLAAINAIEKAVVTRRYPALIIRTESDLMINSLTSSLQNLNINTLERMLIGNRELLRRFNQLMGQIQVRFEKTNFRDYGNNQAKQLANNGAHNR